jgi:hypothetical protein
MAPSVGDHLDRAVSKVAERTKSLLKELFSYNTTDFPNFSQVASMIQIVLNPHADHEREALLVDMKRALSHPTQYLFDSTIPSSEWGGAPEELLEQCRVQWKAYCSTIKKVRSIIQI